MRHFLLIIFCVSGISLYGNLPDETNMVPNRTKETYAHKVLQDSLPKIGIQSLLSTLKNNTYRSLDIMAFGRTTKFAEETGTLNPDNRVAKLKDYDIGIYLRPELKYSDNKFGLWLKPRLNIDVDIANPGQSDSYDHEFYFQELKTKWQINKNLYLMAGRYVRGLGSSIFFNPGNPFIVNSGRLNPKLEKDPMDFIELNFSTDKDWDFSLIANITDAGSSGFQEPFFEFKRKYGLLAEYYGTSENLGLILSADEGGKYHLGGHGQKNLTDALIVWTDYAVDYHIDRFYPTRGHWTGLLDYEMINGDINKDLYVTALVGASYTLDFGPTIQLEYLYNGKGYDDETFDMYNQMIVSSSNYNFDITKELSNMNMGRSINTGMPYIRRHYLFSQIGEQDKFGQLNYNLRYLYSLEDGSSQLSSLIEWNIDALEVYSVMLANFGGRETDLNKLIDYQLMFGLIYKI